MDRVEGQEGTETEVLDDPESETAGFDDLQDHANDDGQDGLEVARRKEYERRKKAEDRLLQVEAQNTTLEHQLQQSRAAPKAEPPSVMTEGQITAAYESGDMDAATAERKLLEVQRNARDTLKAEIKTEVRQERIAETETTSARTELDEYIKAFPDLKDQGSQLFGEVRGEYQRLRRNGAPDGTLTEHLAVKGVVGSLSRLKQSQRRNVDDYDREHRETPREIGGSRRPPDGGNEADADLRKVSRDQREYWTQQGKSIDEQRALAKYWQPSARAG